MFEQPVPPINREHLDVLTGELGIWQHASGPKPNIEFGYCTDDVARALVVDLLHAQELGWEAVRTSAWRSLRFLREAFDPPDARFRNFRGRDGSWKREAGSEDCQGRAFLALAFAMGAAGDARFTEEVGDLFAEAMPAAVRLRALRSISSALIACDMALDTDPPRPALRADLSVVFDQLAAALRDPFAALDTDSDWPWPEPVLTYENALIPRALLVAGRRLDDDALRTTGRRVLAWLVRVQTSPNGTFSPIGSDGWWRRGGVRSRFDQQPIEATALILACREALRQSGDPADLVAIESAYAWFLGNNDLQVPVAVADTGSCHDGLTPRGVNLNQGAESTLMWLTALEQVRQVRRQTATGPRNPDPRPAVGVRVGSRP